MARVLGKPIDEQTQEDIRRVNLPGLAADMEKLTTDERAVLFERIDAIVYGLMGHVTAGRRVVHNRILGHEEGFTSEDYGRGSVSKMQAQAFLKKTQSPADL